MHKLTKLLTSIALAITLSACASVQQKGQLPQSLSVAPAIDVSYSEVNKNIPENIGLNVRWGGQIIGARKVGDVTELTVFSYPLSKEGRPIPLSDKEFDGGRFIVEVGDYDSNNSAGYLTVYGQISGQKTLVNGPRSLVIPVVTAVDSTAWEKEASRDRRGIAYYSLGLSTGHFNSYYGYGNRGFARFGLSSGYYSYNGLGFRSRSRLGRRY